jgi:hypothetical protein
MTWQQRQELQLEQQQSKMSADLNQYVGRSIADYVIAKGPPASTIEPDQATFPMGIHGAKYGGRGPGGRRSGCRPS